MVHPAGPLDMIAFGLTNIEEISGQECRCRGASLVSCPRNSLLKFRTFAREPRQRRNRIAQGVSPGTERPHPVRRLTDIPLPRERERGRGGGWLANPPLAPWARFCRSYGATYLTNF